MIKLSSKYLLLIISTLLGVIVLSMFSSFFIFKKVSGLQVTQHQIEKVLFTRQYEFELLKTTGAFAEAYPMVMTTADRDQFNKWFNVLWSRVQSFNTGSIGKNILASGFDYQTLDSSMRFIDSALKNNSSLDTTAILEIRKKLSSLISASHSYHQQRNFISREVELQSIQTIYTYYRISLILSSLTLFFGFVVSFFLYRKNKTLLDMQSLLEERVDKRTSDLKDKNLQLKNEVLERYIVEERLVSSQAEIQTAKERALHQLNFDPLTNLASRSLFTDRFNQALIRATRNQTQTALLFLDLDRFKNINDTLGHSIGDELLKNTAQRINRSLRQGDTAARFGGDEFAVLLPDITGIIHVKKVVQRILAELSSPFSLSGTESYVSASIGIALYPEDGNSSEILLRKADNAMYKAKEKGRNTFQFFTQQMEVEANKRRLMESALHKAVKNLDFHLQYQPIINIDTGKVTAAEALIRWRADDGKYISPAVFIPLAEELGLIVTIGEWVLSTACTEAVKWQQQTRNPLTISVNLSSRQFQNNDISTTVERVLAETGLAAKSLTLEITESLLIDNNEFIIRQLQNIRDLGVSLAIDDFGTGYSSLSYLKKFPINILKIDQSFIRDLTVDKNDAELVKAVLSLAKSLQLGVVAEGVEYQQQADFLRANGCPHIQGFLYSAAIDSPDFIDFSEKYNAGDNQSSQSIFSPVPPLSDTVGTS